MGDVLAETAADVDNSILNYERRRKRRPVEFQRILSGVRHRVSGLIAGVMACGRPCH